MKRFEGFTKPYNRSDFVEVRPTLIRRGCHIPLVGWRTEGRDTKYIKETDAFDELNNFMNSRIGELASPTKSTKGVHKPTFDPNVRHFIFGFFRYLPVSRPCYLCVEAGCGGNCDCPLEVRALEQEVGELNSTGESEHTHDLTRNFTLRRAINYGAIPTDVQTDGMTPELLSGQLLVPAEEIRFTDRAPPAVKEKQKTLVADEHEGPDESNDSTSDSEQDDDDPQTVVRALTPPEAENGHDNVNLALLTLDDDREANQIGEGSQTIAPPDSLSGPIRPPVDNTASSHSTADIDQIVNSDLIVAQTEFPINSRVPHAGKAFPHGVRKLCLQCKSYSEFSRGRCTEKGCNFPFSRLPGKFPPLSYRFFLLRPLPITIMSDEELCDFMISEHFGVGQVERRNEVYVFNEIPPRGNHFILQVGFDWQKTNDPLAWLRGHQADLKAGKYDAVGLSPDGECASGHWKAKLDLVHALIFKNMLRMINSELNDLFSLTDGVLNQHWARNGREIGVAGTHMVPLGLALLVLMLDNHR